MSNEKELIKTGTSNNPSTRAIILEMREEGRTDTEIVEFLLSVLPEK